jgi:hypothetical protein
VPLARQEEVGDCWSRFRRRRRGPRMRQENRGSRRCLAPPLHKLQVGAYGVTLIFFCQQASRHLILFNLPLLSCHMDHSCLQSFLLQTIPLFSVLTHPPASPPSFVCLFSESVLRSPPLHLIPPSCFCDLNWATGPLERKGAGSLCAFGEEDRGSSTHAFL